MSLITIPLLLKSDELAEIDALLQISAYVDGAATASLAAKSVKSNMQIDTSDKTTLPKLQLIMQTALQTSPLFQIAANPKHIYPIVFSRYGAGMTYGWHVDSPLMGNPPIRTDLAMTIFLSDPSSYEGGELLISGPQGITSYKPAKGDAVLYPCNYLHCVNPVTKGYRNAAVTWIQSQIASN